MKTPEGFREYVSGLTPVIKRHYDRAVNRDLSQHNSQELFRRNVTMVLRQAYEDAMQYIPSLLAENVSTDEVLQAFDGLIEETIRYALQKHRSSCALSNFPAEHNPDQDYIDEVIQAVTGDWSAFVGRVKSLLAG